MDEKEGIRNLNSFPQRQANCWPLIITRILQKERSNYMPNKLWAWNALSQQGNPTQSLEVNTLIKAVKRSEVRRLGKASCARRPLELSEFRYIVWFF